MIEKLLPLLIPLFVIQTVLQVVALIQLKKEEKVRFDNKLIWVFIIVLGTLVGSICYLTFGGLKYEDSSID